MLLTERKTPLIHASDAASLGIYDLKNHAFDIKALEKLGIDVCILPEVTAGEAIAGYCRGIIVSAAIGDNQAAFLGSAADIESGMLINIGTGSQISYVSDYKEDTVDCELRPLVSGKYIMAGSALCGGRAYAAMEEFLRSFAKELGQDASQYVLMEKLAGEAEHGCGGITVDTRFAGARSNPNLRGSITGIDTTNLTPGNLIRGTLEGMVEELHAYVADREAPGFLVDSGDAIRKNSLLASIIEAKFGCSLFIPLHLKEAAFGAALFSLVASAICPSFSHTGQFIRYTT